LQKTDFARIEKKIDEAVSAIFDMHEISTPRVFVILPEQLPDDEEGSGDMLDYANEKMEIAIGWFDKVTSLAATASEFADDPIGSAKDRITSKITDVCEREGR